MQIKSPLIITPRLMPGARIGNGFISLDIGGSASDGRTVYRAFIDVPGQPEYEVTDLRSGCQGGSVQQGLESLLAFLGAAAESYSYRQRTIRTGENEDLFPPAVVAWAAENADEISMLQCELEEGGELITD